MHTARRFVSWPVDIPSKKTTSCRRTETKTIVRTPVGSSVVNTRRSRRTQAVCSLPRVVSGLKICPFDLPTVRTAERFSQRGFGVSWPVVLMCGAVPCCAIRTVANLPVHDRHEDLSQHTEEHVRHLRKTHPFFSSSHVLSRACLGKMITLSLKWRKRDAFFAPGSPRRST